ncbi:hypothetical protein R3P38DRAFT_3212018 [Favolaschia claudopus]|uniref:Uncharacterized protein n=1 Tax=Favolaschia claudopus TaxID=2862362 RepID=A0AAW0AF71_9AGAR
MPGRPNEPVAEVPKLSHDGGGGGDGTNSSIWLTGIVGMDVAESLRMYGHRAEFSFPPITLAQRITDAITPTGAERGSGRYCSLHATPGNPVILLPHALPHHGPSLPSRQLFRSSIPPLSVSFFSPGVWSLWEFIAGDHDPWTSCLVPKDLLFRDPCAVALMAQPLGPHTVNPRATEARRRDQGFRISPRPSPEYGQPFHAACTHFSGVGLIPIAARSPAPRLHPPSSVVDAPSISVSAPATNLCGQDMSANITMWIGRPDAEERHKQGTLCGQDGGRDDWIRCADGVRVILRLSCKKRSGEGMEQLEHGHSLGLHSASWVVGVCS